MKRHSVCVYSLYPIYIQLINICSLNFCKVDYQGLISLKNFFKSLTEITQIAQSLLDCFSHWNVVGSRLIFSTTKDNFYLELITKKTNSLILLRKSVF